jgi:hypothetical protein
MTIKDKYFQLVLWSDAINAPSLFTSINEYRILKMISISFYPLRLLLIVKIAGQTCAKRDNQGLLRHISRRRIVDIYATALRCS